MLPRPPPKDQFLSANTDYINQDLAEAVRDSVHIKSPDWSNRGNNSYSSAQQFDDPYTHTGTRRTPSPNPPRPINVFQPNKPSYNDLSPEVDNFDAMASDPASAQPALPSARMQQLKNPFEEDEIEPAGTGAIKPPDIRNFALEGNGAVQPRRNKFSRAQTGTTTSSSSTSYLLGSSPSSAQINKARTRRSLSTNSYGLSGDAPSMAVLMEGQRKGVDEKKGSRHADVIDTWDPTGLGSAMWHHAGPYDAAAPSRNTNLPTTKAPMKAFEKPESPVAPPRGPSTISLSPPVPPAKDTPRDVSEPDRRRPSRGISTGRRSAGDGLTGQYSTSMPSDGGYFPNIGEEDPQDEVTLARIERQRERESKRKALKAAWGIDTPEPFEDYGGTPNDGPIDRFRLGIDPRTPPIKEDSTSPTLESPPPLRAVVTATNVPPGGIKRTKSLMQKIKTMRENPNIPFRGQARDTRPYSPNREISPMSSEVPSDDIISPSAGSATAARYPHLFDKGSGRSPSDKRSSLSASQMEPPSSASIAYGEEGLIAVAEDDKPSSMTGASEREEIPSMASKNGYTIVESPSSKARAIRALQREAEHHTRSASYGATPSPRRTTAAPPVAPVLHDFDDYWYRREKVRFNSDKLDSGELKEVKELKRKTSMVKKLRDRIVK
ncbi:hypothetical protein I305_03019 [Cryptococcus gattii E566]|uniref:Uncharacterized protein n=2 Tax=Cryptococcus gattii TaxID=37769 RepID=E6QZK2_CRYGW|nr:Hypothetical Protein CGB_A3100C [Cryptococcus gattii WM276]ADV19588.1 Hypothetical Protein CGB_A3100C [Cryptococcus gattii WM276]KIR79859.1 hypothetical protein I306_03082 [Cryptococcus gattii EJB2]KIY34239.1 hypothetical protein I305_03019 [Cryptococcus gattii E566]KJE00954.1 hypothetical protein I311_05412 [Cryptococcus gattii NT-10]